MRQSRVTLVADHLFTFLLLSFVFQSILAAEPKTIHTLELFLSPKITQTQMYTAMS